VNNVLVILLPALSYQRPSKHFFIKPKVLGGHCCRIERWSRSVENAAGASGAQFVRNFALNMAIYESMAPGLSTSADSKHMPSELWLKVIERCWR
jgi:hypothetical protein